jgi:hypothetical protein
MYLKLEQRSVNCPVENSNELRGYLSLCAPRRAPSGDVNLLLLLSFLLLLLLLIHSGFSVTVRASPMYSRMSA